MKLPLRQDKSRKGGWGCDLKPFVAIQRVQPLTATSVAGVHRRAHRRAYRRAAYASAVAGVGPYGYGSSLANCGYYLPYGTSYAAPCGVYSSSYAQAYVASTSRLHLTVQLFRRTVQRLTAFRDLL